MVLAERGTPRDAEVWAQRLLEKIAQHEFEISGQRFRSTASAALVEAPVGTDRFDAIVGDVQEAVRRTRAQGGNRLIKVGQSERASRAPKPRTPAGTRKSARRWPRTASAWCSNPSPASPVAHH